MNRIGIGLLAVGVALVAAIPGSAAQERPRVSLSESARAAGPTCVVGGAVSDCAGSGVVNPAGVGLGPAPLVTAPLSVPILTGAHVGPIGGTGGIASDVDVNRSTRSGSAVAR